MPISIIIPTLNDAAVLEDALQALQPFRARGHEVLVVDGGSRDGTVTIARKHADRVLMSGTGQALQMNAGSEFASHEVLLFLLVDTRLPADADVLVEQALQTDKAQWGHFGLRQGNGGLWSKLAAATFNWRADAAGLAGSEQGIFVTRQSFERVKGFDMVPSDEGAALCRKLLEHARPIALKAPVTRLSRTR